MSQNLPAKVQPPDGGAIAAASQLPPDLAIVKMENDAIMAIATTKPLDYKVVLADLKEQLEVSPRFAEEAVYEKPVGKGEGGQMAYARGLSIFAAEAVAASMGYSRCRRSVAFVDGQPDAVQVTCSFTNYRNGTVSEIQTIVSRKYKTRQGAVAYHPEDRFFDIVVKSAQSKGMREAILRAVPPAIRLELERMVEETLGGFLDADTQTKLVVHFGTLGVGQEQIEGLLGKRVDAFNQGDRRRLLMLANALKQGETTIEEVFGTPAEAKTEQKTGGLKEKLAMESRTAPAGPSPKPAAPTDPAELDEQEWNTTPSKAPGTPASEPTEFVAPTSAELRDSILTQISECKTIADLDATGDQLDAFAQSMIPTDYQAATKAINAARRHFRLKPLP